MPKVSVIVPCYNHAKYLPQRLESIINQTFTDIEIIILDDCSTDNSWEIIQNYAANKKVSHTILNPKNSGSPFVQWQKGVDLAQGEYIWIAESDDFSELNFIEKHLAVLENKETVDLSFCPSSWVNTEGEIIDKPDFESTSFIKNGVDLIKNEFTKGCIIYNASSAIFKKKLLENVDFEQINQYKFTGDWLFWVQLIKNTHVCRISERLNYFRRHAENVSTKSNKLGLQFSEGYSVVKYIFSKYNLSFLLKRKINMFWALKVSQNKDVAKQVALKLLPQEVRIWYYLLPVLRLFI